MATPGDAQFQAPKDEDEKLQGAEAFRFRSMTARVNFLAQDRADIQYCSKCLSQHMANPTVASWPILKKIGKYLVGKPRAVLKFEWANEFEVINGYADSDWAGDRVKAKSTSGGAIMWGNHTCKTWSTTQQTVALSSGEAELYALTKVAAQVLGIMAILRDFGDKVEAVLHTDSTAAMGMVYREGLGRTRHIQVQYLWIQERVRNKELGMKKVDTKSNVADLMTKHLTAEVMRVHLDNLGITMMEGRSKAIPDLKAVSIMKHKSRHSSPMEARIYSPRGGDFLSGVYSTIQGCNQRAW